MQPLELKIVGQADSAIAAANEVIVAHEKILKKTREAGGETSQLEARIAALRAEATKQWSAQFEKGLEAVIADTRTAATEVARLKELQASLQSASSPVATAPAAEAAKAVDAWGRAIEGLTTTTAANGDVVDAWGRIVKAGSKASDAGALSVQGLAAQSRLATIILQSLTRASHGGADAVLGIATAGKAAGGAVAAGLGPGGIAAIAIGTLGAGLLALLGKMNSTGDGAKSLGDRISKAVDQAEKLGGIKFTDIIKGLADTDEGAEALQESLVLQLETIRQIAAARAATLRTEIQNDPTITEPERARRLARVDLGEKQAEAQTAVDRAAIKAQIAEINQQGAQERVGQTREVRDTSLDALAIANRQKLAADERERLLTFLRESTPSTTQMGAGPVPPEVEDARARVREIESQFALADLDRAASNDGAVVRADLVAGAKKASEELLASETALAEATRKLSAARGELAQKSSTTGQPGTADTGTIQGNLRRQAEIEEEARRRQEADEAARITVRRTNESAAKRAVDTADNAITNPAVNDNQRALATKVREAAKKAQDSGTTDSLAALTAATQEFQQAFVGQNQAAVDFYGGIIAAINSAGLKSRALDEQLKARQRALEQSTLDNVSPPPSTDTRPDAQRAPTGRGTITVEGEAFTPAPRPNTRPLNPRTPTPIVDAPAPTPIVDTIAQPLQDAASALNESAAALTDAAASIDIPRRATGGPVKKDQPYIVGEKRPEVFVPDQDGTIKPDANAPTPPRGPTPANPSGSGLSNAQWKAFYQANPERGRAVVTQAHSGIDPNSNEGAAGRRVDDIQGHLDAKSQSITDRLAGKDQTIRDHLDDITIQQRRDAGLLDASGEAQVRSHMAVTRQLESSITGMASSISSAVSSGVAQAIERASRQDRAQLGEIASLMKKQIALTQEQIDRRPRVARL